MKRILLLTILLCPLLTTAQRSYKASDSTFANPERGFYVMSSRDSDMTEAGQGGAFTLSELQAYRNGTSQQVFGAKVSLVRRIYYLNRYRHTANLPSVVFNAIKADCAMLRSARMKMIFTAAYVKNERGPFSDSATIMGHLGQLRDNVFTQNSDVIAVYQAGFIGADGEWASEYDPMSANYGDDPSRRGTPGNSDTTVQRVIIQKYLQCIPTSRMVLNRYPRVKRWIWGTTPLAETEAFGGSERSRIGHYNDAFSVNWDDYGTFDLSPNGSQDQDPDTVKPYLADETKYLWNTVETDYYDPTYTRGDSVIVRMRSMHVSSQNCYYDPIATSHWREDTCFASMDKHMGYRLRLVSSTLPHAAAQGGKFRLQFTILNDGYAAPANPRNLELILLKGADSLKINLLHTRQSPYEPRFWLPGPAILIDTTFVIPTTMPIGRYGIFLNLPDPCDSLRYRPEYSIRLANDTMWVPSKGWNNMHDSVDVYNVGLTADIVGQDLKMSWNLPPIRRSIVQYHAKFPSAIVYDRDSLTSNVTESNGTSAIGAQTVCILSAQNASGSTDNDTIRVFTPPSTIAAGTPAWSGVPYLSSNVTVPSGVTLTISPGTKVSIKSGSGIGLTVNGLLCANGTAALPIPFPANSATWSGIYIGGSGANNSSLQYVTIQGVQTYGGSALSINATGVQVQHCTISGTAGSVTRGIYLSNAGSPDISYNAISGVGIEAVAFDNTNGNFYKNTVTGNNVGVVCANYSSPSFGKQNFYAYNGNNKITASTGGVYLTNNSSPLIGTQNNSYYGYNSIVPTSGYRVSANGNCYPLAEQNWWGSYPPSDSWFYRVNNSTVDYTPSLNYNPNPNLKAPQEISVPQIQSIVDPPASTGPDAALLAAIESRIKGDFGTAKTQLVALARACKDKNCALLVAQEFMNLHRASVDPDLYASVGNLTSAFDPKDPAMLMVLANMLLDAGKNGDAVTMYDQIASDNPGTEFEKGALLCEFYLELSDQSKYSAAKGIIDRLQKSYATNSDVLQASWVMGLATGTAPQSETKQPADSAVTLVGYELGAAYPNPFNPSTQIRFSLPVAANVSLSVYDVLGRKIASLASGQFEAGPHTFVWDASKFSSGVYFTRLCVMNGLGKEVYRKVSKLLLMK